jgi:hypothetical protein
VDYANFQQILFRYFIGKSLEAETAATAAILDLYFHCKKSDAYIWQLSKGLVHLWYLEKKGQPYGLA